MVDDTKTIYGKKKKNIKVVAPLFSPTLLKFSFVECLAAEMSHWDLELSAVWPGFRLTVGH